MPESTENPAPKLRCTVYIDGFNWYYGIFQKRPAWKWLNIQSLFEEMRTSEEVVKIGYFTARVPDDERARSRQGLYLEALRTLPKVKLELGSFRTRERLCKGTCGEKYRAVEEKKTDVNIAVAMIADAVDGVTDSIVLVSGDSDQEPAVAWIRNRFPKIKITVYIPALPEDAGTRQNHFYGQVGATCRLLPLDYMGKHQFPNPVVSSKGFAWQRPASWV